MRPVLALILAFALLGSSGCFSVGLHRATIDDERWPTSSKHDIVGVNAATVTRTAQGVDVTHVRVMNEDHTFWRTDLRSGESVCEREPTARRPLPPGFLCPYLPAGARELCLEGGGWRLGSEGLKLSAAPDADAIRTLPFLAEFAAPQAHEAWIELYDRPAGRRIVGRPSPTFEGKTAQYVILEEPRRVPLPPAAEATAGEVAADVGSAVLFGLGIPFTVALDILTAPVQLLIVVLQGGALGGL